MPTFAFTFCYRSWTHCLYVVHVCVHTLLRFRYVPVQRYYVFVFVVLHFTHSGYTVYVTHVLRFVHTVPLLHTTFTTVTFDLIFCDYVEDTVDFVLNLLFVTLRYVTTFVYVIWYVALVDSHIPTFTFSTPRTFDSRSFVTLPTHPHSCVPPVHCSISIHVGVPSCVHAFADFI